MRFRLSTLALLAGGLSAGCGFGGPRVARELVPEVSLEGVQVFVDRGGVKGAWGEAQRLTYRRDTTAVAATGLVLRLARADGLVEVTAPFGSGLAAERHLQVTGGIVATRGADRATTEAARCEPGVTRRFGQGVIQGTDPVTVEGPGYRLTGTGFTLDPSSGEIVIGGGARLVTGLPVER